MKGLAILSARLVFGLLAITVLVTAQDPPQQQKPAGEEAAAQAKPEAMPPKTAAMPVGVDPNSFTLGPEDVIYIRVWREQDLTEQTVVRPDGKVTMPLIGEIQAAGLTPNALAANITEALGKFINSPQVQVHVLAVRSKRYLVDGEVTRPGAYPLAVPTTVFDAITLAGGFREFANKKKITIIRGAERLKFNYSEVVKGKNLDQNVMLKPGDKIVVP